MMFWKKASRPVEMKRKVLVRNCSEGRRMKGMGRKGEGDVQLMASWKPESEAIVKRMTKIPVTTVAMAMVPLRPMYLMLTV